MTVPTVAFSVVMSGATPVTSAVSDNVPISIVKFTRTVCSTCSSTLLLHRPEALKLSLDDVRARRQRGKRVAAGFVARHFARSRSFRYWSPSRWRQE